MEQEVAVPLQTMVEGDPFVIIMDNGNPFYLWKIGITPLMSRKAKGNETDSAKVV